MRILIADDCSTTLAILRQNLTDWGYNPVVAEDGQTALQWLRSADGPRLAILDWSLPKLEGPSVCREIREQQSSRYTYVIFLAVRDGENDLIEVLESGADDFVTKPFSARELKQRVRAGKRIVELQDRLLKSQRKLRMMSTHDELTGVFNRGAILGQLGQELERSQRNSRHLSLLMLDVDHLKSIHDSFGHWVGDEALREVAERLKHTMHSYDSVGRYGEEEFSIILPETDLPHAVVVAERLRSCISDQPFVTESRSLDVTASVGVASTSPDVDDRKTLIQAADKALYRAKSDGRNCTRISLAGGKIIDPLTVGDEAPV